MIIVNCYTGCFLQHKYTLYIICIKYTYIYKIFTKFLPNATLYILDSETFIQKKRTLLAFCEGENSRITYTIDKIPALC